MKMSIRKLVAGSLVCAVAAGSTPFLNVSPVTISQVQAASLETEGTELYLQEETYGSTRGLYGSLLIYQELGTTLKISSTSVDVKNITCTFESSDPSIFTIDNEGVITPKSLGEATLTIHAKTDDGQEQTCKQEVKVVDHFVCGDMSYGLVGDNEFIFLEASYASKDIKRIMLPYMIGNDIIKVIGKESCAGYKNVKLIEVPDTVTTIEERAFADNPSLEFVMIPKSVTEIADNAFGDGKAEDDAEKIIIKGYKGTEAEKFAEKHKDIVTFEAIDGEYEHYKYVYDMKFDGFDYYKTMEVDEEYQFSLKTEPEVVDEDIIFTSEDESIVSVTSGGAAVAKKPGTTQIIATSTTGAQTKTTVVVSDPQPVETPTPTPVETPIGDYPARFINGTDSWSSGWYAIGAQTSVQMPEVEEREGYRFLGWKNCDGIHQPGEWVRIHNLSDGTFIAQWEKIEEIESTPTVEPTVEPTTEPTSEPTAEPTATPTPATGGAVTTGPAIATPDVATAAPIPTPEDPSIPVVTPVATDYSETEEEEPTATPIATEEPESDSAIKKLEEGIKELDNEADTEKKEQVKKASLKIVTKTNKKFAAGKKYTFKAKKINTNKTLKWSVSNKKIATINEKTGVLKAKKAGKVTVTVTCGSLKQKITIKIK